MYSWEIAEYLKARNYVLNQNDYNVVCDIGASPQISRIRYNPYMDNFEMWTTDDYYWVFSIKHS